MDQQQNVNQPEQKPTPAVPPVQQPDPHKKQILFIAIIIILLMIIAALIGFIVNEVNDDSTTSITPTKTQITDGWVSSDSHPELGTRIRSEFGLTFQYPSNMYLAITPSNPSNILSISTGAGVVPGETKGVVMYIQKPLAFGDTAQVIEDYLESIVGGEYTRKEISGRKLFFQNQCTETQCGSLSYILIDQYMYTLTTTHYFVNDISEKEQNQKLIEDIVATMEVTDPANLEHTTIKEGEKEARDARRLKNVGTIQSVIEQARADIPEVFPSQGTVISSLGKSDSCNSDGWLAQGLSSTSLLCNYLTTTPTDPVNGEGLYINPEGEQIRGNLEIKVIIQPNRDYRICTRLESKERADTLVLDGEANDWFDVYSNKSVPGC